MQAESNPTGYWRTFLAIWGGLATAGAAVLLSVYEWMVLVGAITGGWGQGGLGGAAIGLLLVIVLWAIPPFNLVWMVGRTLAGAVLKAALLALLAPVAAVAALWVRPSAAV